MKRRPSHKGESKLPRPPFGRGFGRVAPGKSFSTSARRRVCPGWRQVNILQESHNQYITVVGERNRLDENALRR